MDTMIETHESIKRKHCKQLKHIIMIDTRDLVLLFVSTTYLNTLKWIQRLKRTSLLNKKNDKPLKRVNMMNTRDLVIPFVSTAYSMTLKWTQRLKRTSLLNKKNLETIETR